MKFYKRIKSLYSCAFTALFDFMDSPLRAQLFLKTEKALTSQLHVFSYSIICDTKPTTFRTITRIHEYHDDIPILKIKAHPAFSIKNPPNSTGKKPTSSRTRRPATQKNPPPPPARENFAESSRRQSQSSAAPCSPCQATCQCGFEQLV